MIIKGRLFTKIVVGMGIFIVSILLVEMKRKQPRAVDPALAWPDIIVKDVNGKEIHGEDYQERIRYVQFVGIEDVNNLSLMNAVYSQWSEHIDMFVFTKKYNLLRNRLEGEYPKAIFIEDRYEESAKAFKSTKYGKHYVFDKSGELMYSAHNNIRHENGVKRILNLVVNKKQFRIADHIQKNEHISNLPNFTQVYKTFNDLGKKYLLVGLVYSFCDSCRSRGFVNILKTIHSRGLGKDRVILVLSNEYTEMDIKIFKSQLQVEFPVIIADEVLNRKWQALINEYSKTELNDLAFSIDSSGKIDQVLDPNCGSYEKPFWEEISRKMDKDGRNE